VVVIIVILITCSCDQIGIHGIQIEFPLKGTLKTATYLPEISREQGQWNIGHTSLQAACFLICIHKICVNGNK